MDLIELNRENRLLRQENESESSHNVDDMGQPERRQMRAEDRRLVLADYYSKMVLFVCDHFPGEC